MAINKRDEISPSTAHVSAANVRSNAASVRVGFILERRGRNCLFVCELAGRSACAPNITCQKLCLPACAPGVQQDLHT